MARSKKQEAPVQKTTLLSFFKKAAKPAVTEKPVPVQVSTTPSTNASSKDDDSLSSSTKSTSMSTSTSMDIEPLSLSKNVNNNNNNNNKTTTALEQQQRPNKKQKQHRQLPVETMDEDEDKMDEDKMEAKSGSGGRPRRAVKANANAKTNVKTNVKTNAKTRRRIAEDSESNGDDDDDDDEEEEWNDNNNNNNKNKKQQKVATPPPKKKSKPSSSSSKNQETTTTPKITTSAKSKSSSATTKTAAATATGNNSAKNAWSLLLDGKGKTPPKKQQPKKASSSKTNNSNSLQDDDIANANVRNILKSPYTAGDDLPIITHPQAMFDDMIQSQFGNSKNKNANLLLPLLLKLQDRPLRVATMCSGTESPVLALDMIKKSMERLVQQQQQGGGQDLPFQPEHVLPIEHVFSCEIEPFKQAYIERNFSPPLLFRDIRELGDKQAYTAYGASVDVPNTPGCVDLLVAGTSCVDYSNLNNRKKGLESKGESGQTFWGMMDWIDSAQPPMVIIENVFGAPWDQKVKLFQERGYQAQFLRLDTKDYYIPHTRQRGYLFAVKILPNKKNNKSKSKNSNSQQAISKWADMVTKDLKRCASAELDAFMLPNDDPRVLRGRARLTAASLDQDGTSRAGRVDWTKCETGHQHARFNEKLGDKRPLSGWSESGNTTMPSFAWNEWVNAQVHRIHDLMDINTLRLAVENVDQSFKTMVWNLSQNVGRDTMGKLGLCQCLTPTGVPYVTSRGGPLVGEELLTLQGIPSDDLLLTKESEANLKDLAGNAMSTTVVGACILSALVHGHEALGPRDKKAPSVGAIVPSLVPRPLNPPSEVIVTQELGQYQTRPLFLGPRDMPNGTTIATVLEKSASSSRKCLSEGPDEALPVESIRVCQECGHTASSLYATPERKSFYEEHDFIPLSDSTTGNEARMAPGAFRKELQSLLPMRLQINNLDADSLDKPDSVGDELWSGWKQCLHDATLMMTEDGTSTPLEFRFTQLVRGLIWTAHYTGTSPADESSRLELRISATGATWLLFAKAPLKRGPLRDAMERPVARLQLDKSGSSFLTGSWELCLPETSSVNLKIRGQGKIDSWRRRLGLEGQFASESRYEKLSISVESEDCEDWKAKIDGVYCLLPKCAAACGSLMKKEKQPSNKDVIEDDLFFFLESGRYTLPEDDAYIFSPTSHRTAYGEYRELFMKIDPKKKYRPIIGSSDSDSEQEEGTRIVPAIIPGKWVRCGGMSMVLSSESSSASITEPTLRSSLNVAAKSDGWKTCPEIVSCTIPMAATDNLLVQCRLAVSSPLELNLQKSKNIFQELAFATTRLLSGIPGANSSDGWTALDSSEMPREDGDEVVCGKCAPKKPELRWTPVLKRGKQSFEPMEDGREAAIYERALKQRPNAWVVRVSTVDDDSDDSGLLRLQIGVNAASLVQRALGIFPPKTLARSMMIGSDSESESECTFQWRIASHVDKPFAAFPILQFTSNKRDEEAGQPPNFKNFKLRHEQLRSLRWMLGQESAAEPFFEEEATEAVLPSLEWRAEGRVRRPVLARGGIVADEVGYGKTAITLGLIDLAEKAPPIPEDYRSGHIETGATLVVVPAHLMGQWPAEIQKFLGTSKTVVVIKDLSCLNKITVKQIVDADIVVVNFTVLSNEKYFSRLSRLAGAATATVPKGRHFETVYDGFLKGLTVRVAQIKEDTKNVFSKIQNDAKNRENRDGCEGGVRLDGKKAVYKEGEKAKVHEQVEKASIKDVADPWLLSKQAKENYEKMTCPNLEMFFWRRLVVDEFTYLANEKRGQTLSLILGLKAHARWGLSGTPAHANFNDIQSLATLLGIHLGVEESLPGARKRGKEEKTGLEALSNFLELRTMQWHERRHSLAQKFLDRFVRQNIAEIDEIPYEEHLEFIELPPAERAIYLELDTHLRSLDMKSKSAQRSKKRSTGDRENRMQQVLEESKSAEEALLKRCAHFNMSGSNSTTAMEKCDEIIKLREKQNTVCEEDLVDSIAAALKQRNLILELDPGWLGTKSTEKGEVQDRLEVYLRDVENLSSISGGADFEIHSRIKHLLAQAHESKDPVKQYPKLAEANGEIADEDDDSSENGSEAEDGSKKRKRTEPTPEKKLYDMKFGLREHMHLVTALGKELCGRIRSLRYFQWVRKFQHQQTSMECPSCSSVLSIDRVGVLSSCGHIGCLDCLHRCAADCHCVANKCSISCQARVASTQIVSAVNLGADQDHSHAGKYGAKLTAVVNKVREVITSGDRLIVFVQFDDLKEKIKEALTDEGIPSLEITGNIRKMIKAVEPFQKTKPGKNDPRVLLLKMDDEQSAGLNLTNLNHAIFVHPLLAPTKQAYRAYETQAVGRIRRFGQSKTVHVWRFLVTNSIDTEIYDDRAGTQGGA